MERLTLHNLTAAYNYRRNNLSKEEVAEIYDRLAELEDKLESGQLVELPCKVGDIIYVVPSKANFGLNITHNHEEKNRVYIQTIDEIRINRSGWYVKTCDYMDGQVDSLLGETWFFTKAQAEARLKELQEKL